MIGSSTLVSSLTESGTIDEYLFLVQPAIVGQGRRFFSEKMAAQLRLLQSQELDSGALFLQYARAE